MKKLYLSLGALFLSVALLTAQTQRTVKTTVADVLAQMPAQQQADYDKLFTDLSNCGEEAVFQLVNMLKAPGMGDNTRVDYALSGLSRFVTAPGHEAARLATAQAYGKALQQVTDRETAAFLIRQLQIAGRDESVETLRKYLENESLCGPAARALGTIGTPKAGKALLDALTPSGNVCKVAIVRALADARTEGAENVLIPLAATVDPALEKAVLYALGRCGSAASLDLLADKAKVAGYTMGPEGATEAYIALLKRVNGQGQPDKAAAYAGKLLKNARKAGQVHTSEAALEVLFAASEAGGVKLLLSALGDPDKDYRNAALRYASDIKDADSYKELIKRIPKFKPEVKIDVLNWIASQAADPVVAKMIRQLEIKYELPAMLVLSNQLQDKNPQVTEAAAWALASIQDPGSVPLLVGLLSSPDPRSIALGKAALASFNGHITTAVARAVPSLATQGKIAALELLALRKSDDNVNTVYTQIESPDKEVRQAALLALKEVVTAKEQVRLFGMLQQAAPEDVPAIREAIVSALSSRSPREQVNLIEEQIYRAGDRKEALFYPLLASTGEKKALDMIIAAFEKGNGDDKEAAFVALAGFKGNAAAGKLFAICQDPAAGAYFGRALDAYIQKIAHSDMTAENKYIFLRKAMEIAKTDRQKITLLQEMEKTGTFPAFLYAGTFIEEKPLQQAAASAVMNIALNNKSYTGPEVIRLLTRVTEVLDNPDADYQRQAIRKHLSAIAGAPGFVSMFNGRDLTGWKGLVGTPITRAQMKAAQLAKAQVKADEAARRDWKVENGCLVFEGDGFDNLCTEKLYGDFEMYVDWRLDPAGPEADAGIYLRGTPQVQIWDTARVNVGAQVGSGGLYNNRTNPSKPLVVADNALGEWNTFYIRMVGDRVTVYLNGRLVTDNVILENYWDRALPIFPVEQIELQAHGSKVYYRDLYIKELERVEPARLSDEEQKAGFRFLFDGTNMHQWTGNTVDYVMEDGCIAMYPSRSFGGNLYTKEEFGNFIYRFEFQLTPAANNGVGIRTPMEGDAAYVGMEVQILDCEHPVYSDITPLQHHGSVYGILPAMKHACKPVGEWNTEEIVADGDHIRVTVNGVVVVDGNIRDAVKNGIPDGHEHPGLFNKKGHIAFLGHGSEVKFRNIRIKELK